MEETHTGFFILQWNAQGLHTHGNELEIFINDLMAKPSIICIQETWFTKEKHMEIKSYKCYPKDRKNGQRGGIAIYVEENIYVSHHEIITYEGIETEIQKLKCTINGSKLSVINLYNPCKTFTRETLEMISRNTDENTLICGDFNSHNALWGSNKIDKNGRLIEEFLNEKNLILLNDGEPTRLDPSTGKVSCLDLTFSTPRLATKCTWEATKHNFGSDHFILFTQVGYCGTLIKQEESANKLYVTFKKVNKREYEAHSNEQITEDIFVDDTQGSYNNFISKLLDTIKLSLPKTQNRKGSRTNKKKNPVPWWNTTCKVAIQERNKVKNKLLKKCSQELLIEYKKKKAIAQKIIREAKTNYWHGFCTKINRFTPLGTVWKTVKSINASSEPRQNTIPSLLIPGTTNALANTDIEKANALAENFTTASLTSNMSEEQTIYLNNLLEDKLSNCTEENEIDKDFAFTELETAIKKSKDSTPGDDGVSLPMISYLSLTAKKVLLKLLNKIWKTCELPEQWSHSILVPILKKNQDRHKASSYRPIALTSIFSKIMERMLLNRISWHFEEIDFNPVQSGFRAGRNTIDHLLRLETDARKAIVNKEFLIAAFLDFEKAYDTVPIAAILIKAVDTGFSKHTIQWLRAFLQNRTFRVRVNNRLSRVCAQDKGIPQGSVLSPTLFNIFVNDLPTKVQHSKVSQFADDVAIWKSNRNLTFVTRQIQSDLNNIQAWCKAWGAKLSSRKTKCMVFSRRQLHQIPSIKIENLDIEIVQNFTFLGMMFDSQLTWKPHIENIKTRCLKRINVLKSLIGSDWGSDTTSMLLLYRTLVRPILDYGSEVYDSAKPTITKLLDSVQYNALKTCSGTTFFTSLPALQTECGEMPLDLRRKMISSKHFIKLKSFPTHHPIREPILPCWHYELLDFKNESPFIKRIYLPPGEIESRASTHTKVPPWLMPTPSVSTHLHEEIEKKHTPTPEMTYLTLNTIYGKWKNNTHIYTDGSKDQNQNTSAAVYVPKYKAKIAQKTSPISIFRAEQLAITLALDWIKQNKPNNPVIFCDSLSVLCDLKDSNSSPLTVEIRHKLQELFQQQIKVNFEWIPSHCDIRGNDKADTLAKNALEMEHETKVLSSTSEMNNKIYKYFMEKWQTEWENSQRGRFLYQLQPAIMNLHTKTTCTVEETKTSSSD